MKNKKRVLVVAAHPDDEVLGCFATLSKMIKEGCEGYVLILSAGVTSRSPEFEREKLKALKGEMQKAHSIIGVKESIVLDLEDNKFDSYPLLDVIKKIESEVERIEPDIIFTHSERDLNIDHQITNKAVVTATRPIDKKSASEVYAFEILSSSEWSFKDPFIPDTFVDVTDAIGDKKEAMSAYKSELREFPHPRSIEGIEYQSRSRGMSVGYSYAECFTTIRRRVDSIKL